MLYALAILLNILLFVAVTFGTSLIIEKYYQGRLKWILVPAFTLLSGILLVKTDFVLRVLSSITAAFSLHDFSLIVLGGIVTGVFFSFL
jgi:hypothetical protein